MTATRRRVARKAHHACGGYCPPIQPGDVYLEHVAFPGEDAMDGATQPWRIRECAGCATRYGRAHLLAPRPRNSNESATSEEPTPCPSP